MYYNFYISKKVLKSFVLISLKKILMKFLTSSDVTIPHFQNGGAQAEDVADEMSLKTSLIS